MSADMGIHGVSTITLRTKQSGESQWLEIIVFNDDGKKELELTLFAKDGKPITLKLGEEE